VKELYSMAEVKGKCKVVQKLKIINWTNLITYALLNTVRSNVQASLILWGKILFP
jgi:hypothetical protein